MIKEGVKILFYFTSVQNDQNMGYMLRNEMFSKLFASQLDQSATSEDGQVTRAQMVCKNYARGLSHIRVCRHKTTELRRFIIKQ